MRTRTSVLALLLAIVGAMLIVGAVAGGNATFTANLKGENEVPSADGDAHGVAHIELFPADGMACFDLKWKKIDGNVTGAHIHQEAVGANGPIVVGFFGFPPPQNATNFPGDRFEIGNCVAASETTLNAILANPSNYYVNVHSQVFPGGAVRDQLH